MSLRAELVGATRTDPAFAVLLPTGWQAYDAAFQGIDGRLDAALGHLPVDARGPARARIGEILGSARAEAARADVIRVFAPSGFTSGDVPPVTLTASWITAPSGGTAADLGAGLIGRRGAKPLDPAQTILKWPTDALSEIDGTAVAIHGAGYLLRVPGRPHRALVFRSTILHAVGGTEVPDAGVEAMGLLCDAIVASVRWRNDA